MSAVSKGLKFAAGILLTVFLISMSYYAGKQSSKVAYATAEEAANKAQKIESADIALLTSKDSAGDEVCNAVKKYMNDINVTVITLKDKNSGGTVYDKSSTFINSDVSKTNYIYADAVFSCNAVYDKNDVLTGLIFTQKTSGNEEILDPTNLNDANKSLAHALGITDDNVSWEYLINEVKKNKSGVNDTALAQQQTITDLQNQLNGMGQRQIVTEVKSGSLDKMETANGQNVYKQVQFNKEPISITVTCGSDSFVLYESMWYKNGQSFNDSLPFEYSASGNGNNKEAKLINKSNKKINYVAYFMEV